MKRYFAIPLLFSVSILLCSTINKQPMKDSVLKAHKWTLVEITQNENDTINNLTMFLAACEKDNFIEYADNGTYTIKEGAEKCKTTDGDVKGVGDWSFDPKESILIDSYQGGKKIEKKIITLTDEILKFQYYGEGKKIYTQTYFSEVGIKDDANRDLIVDNSDASQNITQIIKGYLESTDCYIFISRKDFQNGKASAQDDKNGLKPTVMIMPFTNESKEAVNSTARNTNLIEQGKKANVDYVITGNLINSTSNRNQKNELEGAVKFEVFILDVAVGTTSSKIISDKDKMVPKAAPKAKKSLFNKITSAGGKIALGALSITSTLGYGSYYGLYNPKYYSTYNSLFKAGQVVSAASATASVFSDVSETVRSETYNKNSAQLEAVSKTSDNLTDFVSENIITKIKISEISGSGKKAQIIIEAGSNIGLEKGDKLSVVSITYKTIVGKLVQQKKILGEIEVQELVQDVAAICSFEDGRDDITKAFKETPKEVFVAPQAGAEEKK